MAINENNMEKNFLRVGVIQQSMIKYVNLGLFACEVIKEIEYIVEYTGHHMKNKPRKSNDYIIEVNCPNRSN